MFITFEGIEGSGKTTQINHTLNYLTSKGYDTVSTREPGDTRIGKKIRSILLDPENKDLVSQAELFLYAADRAQHIAERILPSLAEGKIVVCDRFFDATSAYQGYARGLDLNVIEEIHRLVLDGLKPDLTILFDLDPKTGLERAWKAIENGNRTDAETRFENEKLAFHEAVRAGYLLLAKKEPERIHVIDASKDENAVRLDIEKIIESKLPAVALKYE